MSSPKTATPKALEFVAELLPGVVFKPTQTFSWSPKTHTITYRQSDIKTATGKWSLLHEAAHAVLGHATYESDFELILLEVAAWDQAKAIAKTVGVVIDEDHIQDCVDTYRDWLHERSTCPTCGSAGLQSSPEQYHCYNCQTIWTVSSSRFCRPYRRKQTTTIEKPPGSSKNQTTFQ